jgi:hypothetical protein
MVSRLRARKNRGRNSEKPKVTQRKQRRNNAITLFGAEKYEYIYGRKKVICIFGEE